MGSRDANGKRSSGVLGSLACVLVLSLLGLSGCAPKQPIPLDLAPAPLVVYLDGERLDEIPEELILRANRDHTVFVKRDGYRPQLVILTTGEVEGEAVLTPDSISLELKRITDTAKALTVELEEVP